MDLHEPGKYLVGIGLVAAGPHFHSFTVLPPSVVARRATFVVPVAGATKGTIEIAFAVAVVSPFKFVALPTTVITPFALVSVLVTNFVSVPAVALELHELVRRVPILTSGDVETASDTEVRQVAAANINSVTRARTV